MNRAARRNARRFPADFAFRPTRAEKAEVITNCDHLAHLRYSPALPVAFTEHGALMAASMLNSPHAVESSVHVVRAFVQLREAAVAHRELACKLDQLKRKVAGHDQAIGELIRAIRQLTVPPEPKRRPIGFITPEERASKEGRRP